MKIIAFALLVPLAFACAQEAPVAATPQPAQPAAAIVTSVEALQLAGFPTGSLQIEPTLTAAFQLTPDQVRLLTEAYGETVERTKTEMQGNEDKVQVGRATQRAKKEWLSRRENILNGSQLSLINAVQTALKATQMQKKENKGKPAMRKEELQKVFLENLVLLLSREQQELMTAAGAKLP